MQQFFQSGPKQQTMDGKLTQSNSFKHAIEESMNKRDQLNEHMENMQRENLSYNDYLANQQMNQVLNQNLNQEFLKHNTVLNTQQPTQLNNQNIIDISEKQKSQPMVSPMQYMPMHTGPRQIHPSLMEFSNMIQKEEKPKEDQQQEPQMEGVFKDIIDIMETQDDERLQNSEFLKFVKNLHNGNIKLNEKENNLVGKKGEKIENLEDYYSKNPINYQSNMNNLMEKFKDTNLQEELEEEMKDSMDIFNNINFQDLMGNQANKGLAFKQENKYLETKEETDLVELARQLLRENKTQEALLALEAECQRNRENADAWVLLGRIHSDFDDDDKAAACLLTANEVDPFNIEALHALGISCTNSFEEFQAMIYLLEWIKIHPLYSKYFDKSNPMLDYKKIQAEQRNQSDEDHYSKVSRLEELKKEFYWATIQLMEHIALNSKPDTDLYLALGISNFIPHDYQKSINYFRKAVEINPKDYNCWNKLGAILAHSKLHLEAINAYRKAIEFKPDYLRCWANLGIAYFNMDNYDQAISCYLTALKLDKDNPNVWSYLNSVFMHTNNMEDSQLTYSRDINTLCMKYKI